MINRKINVLFLLPSLRFGGAERQVVDLVNGISRDIFNIHLLTFENELDLLEDLNTEKVTFYNYPRKYKYDFSMTKKIAKIICREDIDIIHCTLQIALLYGFIGKLRAKKKVEFIDAIHTTINKDLKAEIFDRFLYVPLMAFCNTVITVCQNQRIHWSRKFPFLANKFITIHNGIDMEKFKDIMSAKEKNELKKSLGIKEDEFTIGILSEFRPEKGHEYAFKALKVLGDAGEKIKLMLIGDGERKIHLQLLSKELSISENIIWLGYKKDPRPHISICDIVLLPSVETFSIAILEALSMGKPVIATNIGGSSEMIIDGINGFLIKPKDINSIVERLQELIVNKKLRKRLSNNARESVVKKFCVSEMVWKTEALFTKLV